MKLAWLFALCACSSVELAQPVIRARRGPAADRPVRRVVALPATCGAVTLERMETADPAHPSWVQLGGLQFVLATIGFGGWLYLMPSWVAAVACVLLVAAMWAPTRVEHIKGTVATYLAFFAVVGQPFNQSWGLMTAPTWAIAYALGVHGLVRLVNQATQPRSPA